MPIVCPEITEAENQTKGEKHNVLCIKCNVETEHVVILSFDVGGDEPFEDPVSGAQYIVQWVEHYQIIKCSGCKTVSFRKSKWFSEEEEPSETLFPIRLKDKHVAQNLFNAPPNLRRIYRETIDAFNAECFTICAGGLRAIVEGICAVNGVKKGPVEKEVSGKTQIVQSKRLDGKISGLREKGILTKNKAALLHAHRYLGNDALHELQMPSRGELLLGIEIIEHVLEELYEIQDKAKEMEWRRRQRQTGQPPKLADLLRGKMPRNK